jgi:hypothetical protein
MRQRSSNIDGIRWTGDQATALDALAHDPAAKVPARTRRTLENRGMVRTARTDRGQTSTVTERGRAMAQTLAPLKEEAGQ